MALSTSHAILLGNFADADTNEADLALEDNSCYLGTFGSAGAPLHQDLLEVTYDDADNSSSINADNVGSESISYDAGAGTVTAALDSLVVVSATVTYTDGSTQSFTNAVMYQDTTGNVFLLNSNFAGTDLNGANNMPMESINVTAITGQGFSGLFQLAAQDFVCFGFGTQIATALGGRAIEDLEVGDQVLTQDNGLQPIRWIGKRTILTNERLAPVFIRAGALGMGLPRRDLLVSQQHRILVRSKIVRRMLQVKEALVPAKRLVGFPGIRIAVERGLQGYAHLLFDQHEIIFAEGAPAESLLPGKQALDSMGDAARREIIEIFPELLRRDAREQPARCIPPGHQQKRLVSRHLKNAKPLLELAM